MRYFWAMHRYTLSTYCKSGIIIVSSCAELHASICRAGSYILVCAFMLHIQNFVILQVRNCTEPSGKSTKLVSHYKCFNKKEGLLTI